jgi:hypothetical protein
MKKFGMTLMQALLVCAVLALMMPAQTARAEGTPVTLTFALPGGSANVATNTYSAGVAQPANSAIKVLAVEWLYAGTAATNGTLSVTKSAGGPAWKTVAHGNDGGAAYSGVSFETNDWYIRRGNSPTVTASVTNACTVTVHGLEQ